MPLPLIADASSITHGIQLAVAPVFVLTAVSGMISAVAGRLARIIDRARLLQERLRSGTGDAEFAAQARQELVYLRRRGLLANGAIGLLTLCAFMIGFTIIVLFVGEITTVQSNRVAMVSFLMGIGSFLCALACFLAETLLATKLLDFSRVTR